MADIIIEVDVLSEEDAKCVLDSDAFYTIIGNRGSGKTTLMRRILRILKHKLERGVVLCPTLEASVHYGDIIPFPYIHAQLPFPSIRVQPQERLLQGIHDYGLYEGLFVIADDWSSSPEMMRSGFTSRLCLLFQHQFGWETGKNKSTEINEWLKYLHLDKYIMIHDLQRLVAEYLVQGSALVMYSAQYLIDVPRNIRARSQWFISVVPTGSQVSS